MMTTQEINQLTLFDNQLAQFSTIYFCTICGPRLRSPL